jgi:hypothetical protein
VIPFGEAVSARNGHAARPSVARRLAKRHAPRPAREPHLPVQVRREAFAAWAIAEDMTEQGATLLMPESVPEGARVHISHWGNGRPRECQVVRWESLKETPLGLFRVEVRQTSDV